MVLRFPDYDKRALREARQRLVSVYSYYYSSWVSKRIETIIKKIDKLLEDIDKRCN